VANAGVAQLVEQLICNHQVGGSSPFTGSSIYGHFSDAGGVRGLFSHLVSHLEWSKTGRWDDLGDYIHGFKEDITVCKEVQINED
jgi:hypothetical protein